MSKSSITVNEEELKELVSLRSELERESKTIIKLKDVAILAIKYLKQKLQNEEEKKEILKILETLKSEKTATKKGIQKTEKKGFLEIFKR
ncbi:MAG: hypothetical protein ACP5JK_02620 [Candidatus Aenigmatarchaeota archaeon]|jgi:hypothetical protein